MCWWGPGAQSRAGVWLLPQTLVPRPPPCASACSALWVPGRPPPCPQRSAQPRGLSMSVQGRKPRRSPGSLRQGGRRAGAGRHAGVPGVPQPRAQPSEDKDVKAPGLRTTGASIFTSALPVVFPVPGSSRGLCKEPGARSLAARWHLSPEQAWSSAGFRTRGAHSDPPTGWPGASPPGTRRVTVWGAQGHWQSCLMPRGWHWGVPPQPWRLGPAYERT